MYRSGFQEKLAGIPAVQAVLGSNPIRMYRFGLYPERTPKQAASCVWQEVSAEAQNILANGRPPAVRHTVQVDVYSKSASTLDQAVEVILDEVGKFAKITLIRGYDTEQDTGEMHFGFDCSFFICDPPA